MNKRKFGRLLFVDTLKGIKKIKIASPFVTIALYIIATVDLVLGIILYYYKSMPVLLIQGVIFEMVITVSILMSENFQPVKVYSNGISPNRWYFISFEKIERIYAVPKKRCCIFRLIESDKFSFEKRLNIFHTTLHIKDTEGFLSTLRQIYGEEKWKEIFVDET